MKRKVVIKASKMLPAEERHPGFGTIESDAYHAGYDMFVDENYNIQVKAAKDKDILPEIEVFTQTEKGVSVFNAVVKFPDIDTRESNYTDDTEYIVDKWARVAKFITKLREFEFDPSLYEDEE